MENSMEAKRIIQGGAVKLSVNGEIIQPVGYMTYNVNADRVKRMSEIDNRIVFYTICASDRGINSLAGIPPLGPHYFVGPGEYDFSEVDRVLAMIAPDGKGPYIMPRVYIAAPIWWEKLYPEECARNYCGVLSGECFGSVRWREDMWEALRALVDHINDSPWRELVIGYHICAGATEEWTPHDSGRILKTTDMDDYSECNRRCFKTWLRARYGDDVGRLNSAWKSKYVSFDEVTIPTPVQRSFTFGGVLRDPERERSVTDFDRFCCDQMADAICFFNRRLKDYSCNRLLTGAFYGYIQMHKNAMRGHFALKRVLDCPDVDFICTTNSRGSVCTYSTAIDSIALRDKLYVYEGDIRTALTKIPSDAMPAIDSGNSYYRRGIWKGPDHKNAVVDLKRTAAAVAIQRCGLWWFDMFGGAFDHPDYEDIIVSHQRLMEEQGDGHIKTEVAFIIDENAIDQFGLDAADVINMIGPYQAGEISVAGAPYHVYLADDLCRDDFPVDDYKCYIFGCFCRPSDELKSAISKKLKRGGKMLIWTSFSGVETEELTDFRVAYDNSFAGIQGEYLQSRFPMMSGPFSYNMTGKTALYPRMPMPAPRFCDGEEEGAYTLANVQESGEPCMLLKQMEDHTSVYSILPNVPGTVLHVLFGMAGVHTFSVTGDPIMAGGRYVSIRSVRAGEKRIYLPSGATRITDVESGEELTVKFGYVDFEMGECDIRVFAID